MHPASRELEDEKTKEKKPEDIFPEYQEKSNNEIIDKLNDQNVQKEQGFNPFKREVKENNKEKENDHIQEKKREKIVSFKDSP